MRALEWLAHLLYRANQYVKNALAAAAERAAEAAPDSEKEGFRTWMQDMFGEHWRDSGST